MKIIADRICRRFSSSRGPVTALDAVSLQIEAGGFVVIRGPSGSGKTTLLLALGGMLRPSSGRVVAGGVDLYAMNSGARTRFRAEAIGFVFQMFHLVPYLSVLDNVKLGVRRGEAAHSVQAYALKTIERLRLGHRTHHKPAGLSTGERQRAALARALIKRPRIILADEPTGNLDPQNASEVLDCLAEFHRGGGTVVVVTHGNAAAAEASQIVRLEEGRVV